MVYLVETELPENKLVFLSLMYIYGLGKSSSLFICKQMGFSKNLKIKDLSKDQTTILVKTIESLNKELGSGLKKSKLIFMNKQTQIKCYKGLRRLRGLPVRGQRTHTNAKTAKKFKLKL